MSRTAHTGHTYVSVHRNVLLINKWNNQTLEKYILTEAKNFISQFASGKPITPEDIEKFGELVVDAFGAYKVGYLCDSAEFKRHGKTEWCLGSAPEVPPPFAFSIHADLWRMVAALQPDDLRSVNYTAYTILEETNPTER